MTSKKKTSSSLKALRKKAETVLKTTSTQLKNMSLPEIQRLVHELQVHQIELEMQNEELRQTQLELQVARDRYAHLYDFAPVGFLTLNSQGQILEANLPLCQLLGVDRKTLLRQKLEKFVMAADQHILRQHLHHVEQGCSKDISDVIRLKHNHSPHLVRLESLYEELGLQNLDARFRVAILDLTEQEQAKTLQKEQAIWVNAMLDTAMDAIIAIDEHQNIVLFNASAEQMFGCASTEALGQPIDRFLPQRFRKAHATHIQKFERKPSAKPQMGSLGEVIGLRANGEEFPIEASMSRVTLENGVRFTVILRDITERRRVEDALAKEQQFIATILETTAALVVVLDPEWRIVRFNKGCEALTGKNFEDMRGKFFLDLSVVSGEDAQEVKDLLRSFKKREFPKSFENAWVDQNRQLHWIKWSNTVITDKEGKTQNIIATGVDITERKQAEQEITRLWKNNETILHSAWEGIYGIDRHGKVTFFSRSAELLTGWTREEVYGQALHPLLHHTKSDGTAYPWKKCPIYLSLTLGHVHTVDDEVLWRKDGTSFPVEYTSMPVQHDNKDIEGAVVTFRDISARIKSETALRESEERFQSFMNHSPVVAFLKDEEGRYVYGNAAFQKLLNKAPLEYTGRTDRDFFSPQEVRIFQQHDQEALKTGKVLEVEETTIDEGGHVRYWWVMRFPVYRQEGQVLLGGVALDNTVRKQAENMLREREEELKANQNMLRALGGKLISAQEDERRRISRELHDDMNQRLAVLAFNIQSTQKGVDVSSPIYQNLQELYDGVSSLSDDVRHLAYQLHPSILDDLGLEVALRSFFNDFSKWEGILVIFTATDLPATLDQELASCLYRVAQECMRNVSRHAQATQVDVRLIGVDGGVRLSIQDNGKGFGGKERKSGKHGLGLIGMEERVRVVQGTYELKSAPGQGTQISVWVPMGNVRSEK